ncbi:MAG: DUF5131 family protein [Planctomycetota bacterium]
MSIQDGKYWSESWNPVKTADGHYHCTKCSPGCLNCWAEGINIRAGGGPYAERSVPQKSQRDFEDSVPEILRISRGVPASGDDRPVVYVFDEKTIKNKKLDGLEPKTFFVCDLCDLFHKDVPDSIIERVFEEIEKYQRHRFLLLTKRPERISNDERRTTNDENLFLGVSVCVESEKWKIDALRQVSAAHRWVSFGPLLEAMDRIDLAGIDWVVMEAESLGGRPGRECSWAWMLSIIGQAKDQGVPVWVKQINYRNRLIRDLDQMPSELCVRELPEELQTTSIENGLSQ